MVEKDKCRICQEPVEDSPPNVPIHDKCWLKLILGGREKTTDNIPQENSDTI